MRRADRLFRIVQYLRGRRLTTAQQLAQWLQVSERTIYRDMADLSSSGTPIEGEAGVGYRLLGSMDLPPLQFELDEIDAIVLGARMVEAWSGPKLGAAALAALAKVACVLPPDRRHWLEASRAYVPALHIPRQIGERFDKLRQAIRESRVVDFVYADEQKRLTARSVRPLSLYFWGEHWTLGACCERGGDFHDFRVDRMLRLRLREQLFKDEAGKRLSDYRAARGAAHALTTAS